MAFNPFHWFRKNQKSLFAVLTIIIMIVFVFSFGRGDLFEVGLQRIGRRDAGLTVTTLYKKKVTERDLEQLARHRKMASDFLFITAFEAHGRAIKDLLDKELKADNIDNPLTGVRFIVEAARGRDQPLSLLTSRDPQAEHLKRPIPQRTHVAAELAQPVERHQPRTVQVPRDLSRRRKL